MLKIIIGNKAYSSWSLRGWLAVKQSGLPYDELVVSMYDAAWPERKTQPDLAISLGKVPTLWDGDIPVWDSIAIVDYLDTLTGGTRFWPKDKGALALARSMAAEMHSGYVPLRKACCMNVRRVFPAEPMSDAVVENVARIDALSGVSALRALLRRLHQLRDARILIDGGGTLTARASANRHSDSIHPATSGRSASN